MSIPSSGDPILSKPLYARSRNGALAQAPASRRKPGAQSGAGTRGVTFGRPGRNLRCRKSRVRGLGVRRHRDADGQAAGEGAIPAVQQAGSFISFDLSNGRQFLDLLSFSDNEVAQIAVDRKGEFSGDKSSRGVASLRFHPLFTPTNRSAEPWPARALVSRRGVGRTGMKRFISAASVVACGLAVQANAQTASFTGPRVQLDVGYDQLDASDEYPDLPRHFDNASLAATLGYDVVMAGGIDGGAEIGLGKPLGGSEPASLGSDALTVKPSREWIGAIRLGTKGHALDLAVQDRELLERPDLRRIPVARSPGGRSHSDRRHQGGILWGGGVEQAISGSACASPCALWQL